MLRNLALFLLLAPAAWPAAADFNGRWDITVEHAPHGRAWWLEVMGAGTADLKGKFVGFPGGDLNDIQKIGIEDGELRFSYDGNGVHQEYRAKLADGKLKGTFASGDTRLEWTGARAPEIKDADDGSWRELRPVSLLNGRDISNFMD